MLNILSTESLNIVRHVLGSWMLVKQDDVPIEPAELLRLVAVIHQCPL